MKMFLKLVALVLIGSLFVNLVNSQSCQTPSNQPGNCIDLKQCKELYSIISTAFANKMKITNEQQQLISKSWCGTVNGQHKVCCPTATSAPTAQKNEVTDYWKHPNAGLLSFRGCGSGSEDKIANGELTEPLEYPWMAIIQYRTTRGIEQLCGGTIINPRYILTAAHCVTNLKGAVIYSIVLGEHDTRNTTDCSRDGICADPIQTIRVDKSIPHPQYSSSKFINDIALIRLASDANFRPDNVRPICLPMTPSLQTENLEKILVSGWGKTEKGTTSDVLLKTNLDVVNLDKCAKIYMDKFRLTLGSSHLCAGGVSSDSCSGDSGGPAVSPGQTIFGVKYVQHGVVSAGISRCGYYNGTPGLYARVGSYMKWILDTIY